MSHRLRLAALFLVLTAATAPSSMAPLFGPANLPLRPHGTSRIERHVADDYKSRCANRLPACEAAKFATDGWQAETPDYEGRR